MHIEAISPRLMTLLFSLTSMELAPRLGLAIGAGFALASGLVSLLRASWPSSAVSQPVP